MAESVELKAWARQRSGKGGARSTRREGRIPGILYGDKKDPESIAVEYRAITQQLLTGHFQSTVFTLNVDGTKTRVIPRAVQLDPIRDFRSMSISCGSARMPWSPSRCRCIS